MQNKVAIAVHGGAEVIGKQYMPTMIKQTILTALHSAVQKGKEILLSGGSSQDAVEAAVVILEDCPYFSAGKGAVYTSEGKHELDASFMEGKNKEAGAVCMVTNVKNPIKLARVVMEKSQHVMLVGEGAEKFASLHNLEIVPNSYFDTEYRLNQLKVIQARGDQAGLDNTFLNEQEFPQKDVNKGTVGAVAVDQYGNVCSGSSTGGLTNKKNGRVGDTAIIGSGIYADNMTGAFACTGYGEYFQRCVSAYDASSYMKLLKSSLEEACNQAMKTNENLGGVGGIIAVDQKGNVTLPFNTEGMYRGWYDGSEIHVGIYQELEY